MKDKKIRTHDLQLLSAYLDNELDSAQRQKLETQIENDPVLREKLKDLRRTKLTLSSLSHLKAPRNFTLTPEIVTVRRRKSAPMFRALKLASSIAGILLVALISIELLWGSIGAARQMEMSASVADSDVLTAEDTAEPLIIWDDSGANEAAGRGGSDEQISSTDQDSIEEVEEEVEAAPEEAIQPEEESSKSAEESPILGLNLEAAGEVIEQSEASTDEDSPVERPNVLLWIEITFAVIVVGGLIAFLILRKKY